MRIEKGNNIIAVWTNDGFNLKRTLESGQCFRWKDQNGIYKGTAFGRTVCVRQEENRLDFYCSSEDFESYWLSYFDLDTDYNAIKEQIFQCEPLLKESAAEADGIHILRQEPWEALCSFIISQNSNIPKIKRSVQLLCETFGNSAVGGGFTFPSPESLAKLTPEDLAPLRCGYRAPYIIDAAQKVALGEISFDFAKNAPLEQARTHLMQIKGVGKKVADCALLYGFERLDCFPVDRWIARAMEQFLPSGSAIVSHKYAGIAQLYIFYIMISDRF